MKHEAADLTRICLSLMRNSICARAWKFGIISSSLRCKGKKTLNQKIHIICFHEFQGLNPK